MNYKYLDMEVYKRRQHFEYFNSLFYPYVGLTVNVDITDIIKTVKMKTPPFSYVLLLCVESGKWRSRI